MPHEQVGLALRKERLTGPPEHGRREREGLGLRNGKIISPHTGNHKTYIDTLSSPSDLNFDHNNQSMRVLEIPVQVISTLVDPKEIVTANSTTRKGLLQDVPFLAD